ncbi:MAG: tRNA-binding protein [Flavobacteriaceae bacterium]|nr:tRNA-binding protein [Flavobacteriaceae bacterium]
MKGIITFDDFIKVDIRIGTIIKVTNFSKAIKPAYQIQIDFGDLGIKKTSAQITKRYSKEDLLNKQVSAIINFKPKKIANFLSECLILGIQNGNDVVLLKTNGQIKNGEIVR